MSKTILIADDESEVVELLKLFLEREGHQIVEAYDGKEALQQLHKYHIDIAIIDIMMPQLDGFEVLKQLRLEYKLPVIVISAKNRVTDRIMGLGLGADDFISKPFDPLEVVARVQAQLRRAFKLNHLTINEDSNEKTEIGPLLLDHTSCVLFRRGMPIQITALEYKLLKTFMGFPGKIFTKQQLFELAWSDTYWEDDNAIMVQISRLREKIEDQPRKPIYIRTVRGLGYKFATKEELNES
jgi:DNA-binding response OmpR family regulator